jgi:hypothetical protein
MSQRLLPIELRGYGIGMVVVVVMADPCGDRPVCISGDRAADQAPRALRGPGRGPAQGEVTIIIIIIIIIIITILNNNSLSVVMVVASEPPRSSLSSSS